MAQSVEELNAYLSVMNQMELKMTNKKIDAE